MKKLIVFAPSIAVAGNLCGISTGEEKKDVYSSILFFIGEEVSHTNNERSLLFHNTEDYKEVKFNSSDLGYQTYLSLKNELQIGGFYSFTIREGQLDSSKHIYRLEIERIKADPAQFKEGLKEDHQIAQ